jgi:hypothetical protein
MKPIGAIILLVVLALVLVLAGSRGRYTLAVDRCLDLGGSWNEQEAACASQAWPEDRSRGRD